MFSFLRGVSIIIGLAGLSMAFLYATDKKTDPAHYAPQADLRATNAHIDKYMKEQNALVANLLEKRELHFLKFSYAKDIETHNHYWICGHAGSTNEVWVVDERKSRKVAVIVDGNPLCIAHRGNGVFLLKDREGNPVYITRNCWETTERIPANSDFQEMVSAPFQENGYF